jgi:hypothetical protein
VRPLLAVGPQGVRFLRSRPQADDIWYPILAMPAHLSAVLPLTCDGHHRGRQVEVEVHPAADRAYVRLRTRLGWGASRATPAAADLRAERRVDDVTINDVTINGGSDWLLLHYFDAVALSVIARLSCSLHHRSTPSAREAMASTLRNDSRG